MKVTTPPDRDGPLAYVAFTVDGAAEVQIIVTTKDNQTTEFTVRVTHVHHLIIFIYYISLLYVI